MNVIKSKKVGLLKDKATKSFAGKFLTATGLCAVAVATTMPVEVLAVTDLTTLGTQVNTQAKGGTVVAKSIFGLIGLGMVGVGLVQWKKAQKSGEGIGGPITMIVIGGALVSVLTITQMVSSTGLGTSGDAKSLEIIQ